jgi:hypothetical protein
MPRDRRDADDLAVDQLRLALLVDADNASPAVIEGVLAEVARFGIASVRRLYGDWTSQRHAGWKKVLLDHSLAPVQQFAYTTGKNATDSAMIIDAMDLMYTRRFGGFCLVSSDSDFTRLAQRLREEGLLVLGFGERKTPAPFVAACDKFIYTEVLTAGRDAPAAATSGESDGDAAPVAADSAIARPAAQKAPVPVDLIERAIGESDDDDGWAHLGPVGGYLTKVRPDFDPRLYGFKKLSDLLRAHPQRYELRELVQDGAGSRMIHVRLARPVKKAAPARRGRAAKKATAP